jgi:hypothetical protein
VTKIPIACTLAADQQAVRTEEWRSMIARATTREITDAGARLTFPRDGALATTLADLVVREVECCAFFTFTTTVTTDALVLDIVGPADAWELVAAFAADA